MLHTVVEHPRTFYWEEVKYLIIFKLFRSYGGGVIIFLIFPWFSLQDYFNSTSMLDNIRGKGRRAVIATLPWKFSCIQ